MRQSVITTLLLLASLGAYGREATLAWDTIANAQVYDVQVARDLEFQKLLFEKNISETEVTTSLPFGTFYYRVRARRANRQAGYWSRPVMFTVHAYAPELQEPRESAFYNYYEVPPTVTMQWRMPARKSGENERAQGFEILVTRASGEKALEKRTLNSNFETAELREGEYAWRVRALESNGTFGPFSDVHHFKIERLPIRMPTLSNPAAEDQIAAYRPINFAWSTDPVTPYSDIEVRRADTHHLVFDQKNLTAKTWLSPDFEEGKYEWSVTAKESRGTPGVVSENRKFTVRADVIAAHDFYLRAGFALRSYRIDSTTTRYGPVRVDQSTTGAALVPQFSGSYFLSKGLGFGLDIDAGETIANGAGIPWDRTTATLRFRFGQPGSDQQFYLGYRNQVLTEFHPNVSPASSTLNSSGLLTGLMLNGRVAEKWRLHIDLTYYKPTQVSQNVDGFDGDFGEFAVGLTYQLHSRFWLYGGLDYRSEHWQFRNAGSTPGTDSSISQRFFDPLVMRVQYEY